MGELGMKTTQLIHNFHGFLKVLQDDNKDYLDKDCAGNNLARYIESEMPSLKRMNPATMIDMDKKDENLKILESLSRMVFNARHHYFLAFNVDLELYKTIMEYAKVDISICSVSKDKADPVAEAQVEELVDKLSENRKKKRKHTRGSITQKEAASMCGVSVRLIQKWLAGQNAPERFPGLYDAIVFKPWAENYNEKKRLKIIAVNMNKASPVNPKIIEESHSYSAFSDTSNEDDKRGLEELVADQKKDMANDKKRRAWQA